MRKVLKTDLLVAGGGVSGICAAIAAARKGLNVILVNDRSVLGGNASSEIGVEISGAAHEGLNGAIYAKETGIVEEIRLRMAYYREYGGYGEYALTDAVFFDMIYNEKNIKLILNTVVTDCFVKNKKIQKVFAHHCVNSTDYEILAMYYVDATGNGVLGFKAGAEYKIGREGKDEYNEHWAPEKADKYTMGDSIYFETADAGEEVNFKAPDFAYDISKMDFLKEINKPENFRGLSCFGPHWAYEYGGQVDILRDHDEVEFELRRLIYGIWDYVKNSGKYPKAKNRYLKRVFSKAGTRESRRIIGDYILTENDIEEKRDYEDSVAMGGWPMDIHAPLGIYDTLPASNFVPVTGTYNIPFRCLYSKDIENLMLAGRDISVTHIALGSTRVMATCGATGQAVGTAAYIAKKYSVMPKDIYSNHINELKNVLLNDDQSILHVKENCTKGVMVTASSVKPYENTVFEEYMLLERDYTLAFMTDSKSVQSIAINVKSVPGGTLKYKVMTGIHPETFLPSVINKCLSLEIEKEYEGWITVPIIQKVGNDGKVYIVFEENRNIEIAVGKSRTMGAVTYRMHTINNCDGKNHDSIPLNPNMCYTHFDHCYEKQKNILFKDIIPKQNVFAPENILNGYARPYKNPNLWIAQGDKNESIILHLNKTLKGIDIVLNDDLDTDNNSYLPKSMVKNMQICIKHRTGTKIIEVKENYKRLLHYDFECEDVTKIEIKIIETYGELASVYAVRLYEK